jgi:hypothetical protein
MSGFHSSSAGIQNEIIITTELGGFGFGNLLFLLASIRGIIKKYTNNQFKLKFVVDTFDIANIRPIHHQISISPLEFIKETDIDIIPRLPPGRIYTIDEEAPRTTEHRTLHEFIHREITTALAKTPSPKRIIIKRYLQDCRLFTFNRDIIDDITIEFNNIIENKKRHHDIPISKQTAFIHFRGGDYITHGHSIVTPGYYERAVAQFMMHDTIIVKRFIILTDDRPNAEKYMEKVFPAIHRYDPECQIIWVTSDMIDTITTLQIMRDCPLGGIATNSTFSWWGAFLNYYAGLWRTPRYIFPNKWSRGSDFGEQFNFIGENNLRLNII